MLKKLLYTLPLAGNLAAMETKACAAETASPDHGPAWLTKINNTLQEIDAFKALHIKHIREKITTSSIIDLADVADIDTILKNLAAYKAELIRQRDSGDLKIKRPLIEEINRSYGPDIVLFLCTSRAFILNYDALVGKKFLDTIKILMKQEKIDSKPIFLAMKRMKASTKGLRPFTNAYETASHKNRKEWLVVSAPYKKLYRKIFEQLPLKQRELEKGNVLDPDLIEKEIADAARS